jgi:hypothetical protein
MSTSRCVEPMMMTMRKSKIVMLAGVVVILAAYLLAVPVSAAASQTADVQILSATGNVTAVPAWRNGDFVFWASDEADMAAVAATTIRAITPKPIGPNGISVGSLMPGFAWASVLGATEYRLDIFADAGLSQTVTSITTPVPAAAIDVPLDAGRDYYWTVRVTQPAESGRSWAYFNVSPQATAPVPQVTTAAASRPRAAYTGGTNMIPQAAAFSLEADTIVLPEPIVINLPASNTPASPASNAALPVVIVIGLLLVAAVMTLLLRPYVPD